MADMQRPILSKGEEYVEPGESPGNGPRIDNRPTYEKARNKLLKDIHNVKESVLNVSNKYLLDDVVINIKMRADRSSKSDHPSTFIKTSNLQQLGTKKWTREVKIKTKKKSKKKIEDIKVEIGKDIFVRTSRNNIAYIEELLSKNESEQQQTLIENIRSLEEIYFDDHSNLLKVFDENWEYGRVELVLHPFEDMKQEMLSRLYELINENKGDTELVKVRSYEKGPTFISLFLSRECLMEIVPFNPIRSAHPLEMRKLDDNIEKQDVKKLPKVNKGDLKSSIKLGVFDGGVNSNIDYFKQYVTEHNLAKTEKDDESVEHGSAVVSAALFGDLINYSEKDMLPIPTVSVESYRVLPLSDPKDYDLYEVIDEIEEVVKNRDDIKIYNLSLGPYGPILDDPITRFTYALDNLTKNNKCCFVIAVGNDGDLGDELDRIQAPSDSVNNIAVGSCMYGKDGVIKKTPYSCIGDGREGAKVKPDVVEFGGSNEKPMHFVGPTGEYKMFGGGTSFASPIVARKMAEVLGKSSISTPLTARTLIIHSSNHPTKKHDKFLGYGVVANETDDMLNCEKNKISIIYEGTLLPKAFAKLNIPFISNLDFKGKIKIDWTTAIATDIQSTDTEDYAKCCIEDTFYPNLYKYKMKYPITGKTKIVHIIKQSEYVKELEEIGWVLPKNPMSASNSDNKYKPEQERKDNFKWDTVVKRSTGNKEYKQIEKPYIILHAMERGESLSNKKIHYSVVITVEYINCQEDVYSTTLSAYNKLEKTVVKPINELLVR